ncbi:MAG: class I SAM-dependent methyltransferase [Acidiferrobacterales bacterium]
MAISKKEIQARYERGAKHYDFVLQFYRLIGLRIVAYRRRVVELLRLKREDCVVDLGCGTGLNFPLLIEQIGSQGRVIGVDLSTEMLARARERAERAGWCNIELVQSDMAAYEFPHGVNGVLSTGAFGFVPEYERVIKRALHALAPHGRLVILDGKWPERWPFWLLKLFVWLSRPYGLTFEYFDRHPWESVEHSFEEPAMEQMYGGLLYISSGTAPSPAA